MPELTIQWGTAIGVTLPFALITVFSAAIGNQVVPPQIATGSEALIGETGLAKTDIHAMGECSFMESGGTRDPSSHRRRHAGARGAEGWSTLSVAPENRCLKRRGTLSCDHSSAASAARPLETAVTESPARIGRKQDHLLHAGGGQHKTNDKESSWTSTKLARNVDRHHVSDQLRKVLPEYERGVVSAWAVVASTQGPGIFLIFPPLDRMMRISLRVETMDVPPQRVTRDHGTVTVSAVVFFRVVDPARAVVEVANFVHATSQLAQTRLRAVLGEAELDELLSEREKLNARLQLILDELTEPWGIKVQACEVKHVDLPEQMIRAIARQAEAERERRAKIIHAEGEQQAPKN